MIVETQIPRSALLRQFVESFIFFDGFHPFHTLDRYLPNGNVELIIDLRDRPQFIYDNETLKPRQECKGGWISGIRTEPITIPSGKNARMLIVSFRKGMAYPFFGFPMAELRDQVLNADLVWGSRFSEFRERLLCVNGNSQARFDEVELFLQEQCRVVESNEFISYSTARIGNEATDLTVSGLTEEVGYSRKHLGSIFRNHVGITPKAYMRIMRFQRVIALLEKLEDPDWCDLAIDAGYYDQSHLINDFKRFSGFTPGEYFRSKNDVLNYVPVA